MGRLRSAWTSASADQGLSAFPCPPSHPRTCHCVARDVSQFPGELNATQPSLSHTPPLRRLVPASAQSALLKRQKKNKGEWLCGVDQPMLCHIRKLSESPLLAVLFTSSSCRRYLFTRSQPKECLETVRIELTTSRMLSELSTTDINPQETGHSACDLLS